MNLILPDGSEKDLALYELAAEKAITVPPLSGGTIPHDCFLTPCKTPVMLISRHGVFKSKNLWVETTIVPEGKIYTHVFNMGNTTRRVREGEVISQLIELPVLVLAKKAKEYLAQEGRFIDATDH